MGACYSKNLRDESSHKGKRPKLKHKDPDNEGQTSISNSPISVVPANGLNATTSHGGSGPNGDVDTVTSSRLSKDISECNTGVVGNKTCFVDRGVAPSDSGIESIGTAAEENHVLNVKENDHVNQADLSKKLERLSRGSCHKCGNFRLDDSALTALLNNTYCLCGPRQAGKPSVNPQCQAHGSQRLQRNVSLEKTGGTQNSSGTFNNDHCYKSCMISTESSPSHQGGNGPLKSSLKNSSSPSKKDRSIRISVRSTDSLELALAVLTSLERSQSENSETFIVEKRKAPLAQFDSVDTILGDSPSRKRLSTNSRKSLLSEILDITDSICRCDFYSNEICFPEKNQLSDLSSNSGAILYKNSVVEATSEGQLSHSPLADTPNSDKTAQSPLPSSTVPPHASCSPSKKCFSLPKNVSFATESDKETALVLQPNVCSEQIKLEPCLSEASSGIFTQNSGSSSHLIRGLLESHKRSSSLGSRGVLMSDTSSEALYDCTEDDLASVDLDSLSRVTSLSYNSIRQLMESTEDLCSPLDTAQRMTIDGVECVVIPTETYQLMQSDLATLKQQLLCLSSLMQEGTDCPELAVETKGDTSMVCSL